MLGHKHNGGAWDRLNSHEAHGATIRQDGKQACHFLSVWRQELRGNLLTEVEKEEV
jgi:hypothetical protein